jgi:hypothetical protein
MSAASNYLEAKLLDHSLGTASYTMPTSVYVGLFLSTVDSATTTANLEAGVLTDEVPSTVGGNSSGYAREVITFDAASSPGGSAGNAVTVTFTTAAEDWGTVTHLAIMDAESGGQVLYYGLLDSSKLIETGDTFVIQSGNLTITLA